MLKKLFLSLILSTVSLSLLAQTDFREGAVIQLNGDTLKGFIDYQEWRVSPKSVSFKTSKQATAQTYHPLDIKGFTISNIDQYQSYVGAVSTNKVAFTSLPNYVDTATRVTPAL